MAIAWFLCPYKLRATTINTPNGLRPVRYCAMDDFTHDIIITDKGSWAESEVLGNHAVVKVSANQTTIDAIAATTGFVKLPKTILTTPLSDLSTAQKTAIKDKIESLGYTATEIKNTLGTNIGNKTLGDVLKFIAKRRLKPRYDSVNDVIVCDGTEQTCRPIEDVDKAVKE